MTQHIAAHARSGHGPCDETTRSRRRASVDSPVFTLLEVPLIVAAMLLGIRAARHRPKDILRRGLIILVLGLGVMAIGHGHMQFQRQTGVNLFTALLGDTLGDAAWLAALILSWSLTAYGFRCMTLSSMQDPLTGVWNRRRLDKDLLRALQRSGRTNAPVHLILIDVDHFKAFNDLYGHPAGDRSLRAVAQCLQRTARRATDVVCRYGGEEFAILVSEDDTDRAVEFADVLRAEVENMDIEHSGDPSGGLRVSVGVAACRGAGATVSDLFRDADRALYRAKANGRNRVELAHPSEEALVA